LAWKLALVLRGQADEALLESYSVERLHATRENIVYGAKSTEFMAPPSYGFTLMREAALRLASVGSIAKSLINPRQSTPIEYIDSPLNGPALSAFIRPGMPAPEACITSISGFKSHEKYTHLTQFFGGSFVLLVFSAQAIAVLHSDLPVEVGLSALKLVQVRPQSSRTSTLAVSSVVGHDAVDKNGAPEKYLGAQVLDVHGQAFERYQAAEGHAVLIRPDGYVLAVWRHFDTHLVRQALQPFTKVTAMTHSPSESLS
jgi:3-(3-hydroxy-phenyl)propionate hydroxylase